MLIVVVKQLSSLQANYKINAMRILYELHSLKQRRAYMVIRAEIEEKHRQRVEQEVSLTMNCGKRVISVLVTLTLNTTIATLL